MSFAGSRVLSLESRRAQETGELIRKHGGEPIIAPSMREVPLERNEEAFAFAERLFRGEFDMAVFLTGVGTRFLAKVVGTRHPEPQFADALNRIVTVTRGPKPAAALRELGVTPTIIAPEPNTWREVLSATDGRAERHVAVQEYGRPSQELIDGLHARGCEVTAVPVYQWELPEDVGPLRAAIEALANGTVDVTLFTTSMQITHLLEVAAEMGVRSAAEAGLRGSFIASIGPTTTEALVEHGFPPAMEPSHPKLGVLVREAAEQHAGAREQ